MTHRLEWARDMLEDLLTHDQVKGTEQRTERLRATERCQVTVNRVAVRHLNRHVLENSIHATCVVDTPTGVV